MLSFVGVALGDEVTFEVNAPKVVAVGEPFGVEFSLNANFRDRDFEAPSFEGFDVMAGPSTSSSSSVQFINGKMSQSVNKTVSFVLVANAVGEFTIGEASVKVDGKTYKTSAVGVRVVKEAQSNAGSSAGAKPQTQQAALAEDDVLIVATVDKTKVYKGEPLLVTYKL